VGVFAFDLMLMNDHVSTVSLACFHELTGVPLATSRRSILPSPTPAQDAVPAVCQYVRPHARTFQSCRIAGFHHLL
jgi:hypothetical protein